MFTICNILNTMNILLFYTMLILSNNSFHIFNIHIPKQLLLLLCSLMSAEAAFYKNFGL